MECELATINQDKSKMQEIFNNTNSIAIIGCSPDETKASNKVAKYLIDNGFTVFPVYPKEDEILGQKVYRNLIDIPFKIDMVDIFRKPKVIDAVVDTCIQRGDIYCVWSQLGLVNNAAMQKAQDAGIVAVQNYCTKIEYEALKYTK
jgi:predicted CoA-binding protein